MPTTNIEPKIPKLAYLPVKQIAKNNASQCPHEKMNENPLSGDLIVRL